MIVVDASVAVKWFIDEEGHFDALQLTLRPTELKAPDIIWQKSSMFFAEKFA